MEMQHGDVPHWLLRVIGFMRPCIGSSCFWMPVQIEYLNNSFPCCLALEFLLYGNALNMHSLCTMQSANHVLEFRDVAFTRFHSQPQSVIERTGCNLLYRHNYKLLLD